jgi:hypothetical protein
LLFELPEFVSELLIVPTVPPNMLVEPDAISATPEMLDVKSAKVVNEFIIPIVVYTVPCVILIAVGKPTITEQGLLLPNDPYTPLAQVSNVPLLKSPG